MKKGKFLFIAIAAIIFVFTACGNSAQESNNEKEESEALTKEYKFIYLVPGSIDDPLNKSVYNGMKKIEDKYGAVIQFIEMGDDMEAWGGYLDTALQEEWDAVLTFSNIGSETIYASAEAHPDKKMIIFQEFGEHIPPNVFKVKYSLGEASFLAGALAALVTSSDMEFANDEDVIGFVGGMSFPVINFNYLAGYIEGAKYVNENIKVLVSYADDFGNQEKGAGLAAEQYANGADVIFQAAGGTGYGVLNEAVNSGGYAIGVDIDQALQLEGESPDTAEHILTSVIRDNEGAAFWVLEEHINGTLNYGSENPSLGLAQNGVAIAMNSYYEMIPDDIRIQIDDIMAKIVSGEITVNAGMDMGQEEFDSLVQSVTP